MTKEVWPYGFEGDYFERISKIDLELRKAEVSNKKIFLVDPPPKDPNKSLLVNKEQPSFIRSTNHIIICEVCNNEFETLYKGKKYCSEKCKMSASNRRYSDRKKIKANLNQFLSDMALEYEKKLEEEFINDY